MKNRELVKQAVLALDEKKANDIRVIDVHEVTSMTDYMIIADAGNKNQLQALCDNVQEFMGRANAPFKNREGYSNGGWILLDYYDIIIHIFSKDERSFYDLEHIWKDGNFISLGDL